MCKRLTIILAVGLVLAGNSNPVSLLVCRVPVRYLDEKSVEMSEQSWFLSFPCRYPASTIPF